MGSELPSSSPSGLHSPVYQDVYADLPAHSAKGAQSGPLESLKSGLMPTNKGSMEKEQTASSRFDISTPVDYWATDFKGDGTIANISTSGALIEPASRNVAPGTDLGILVRYFPEGAEHCSVELPSKVVRTTNGGFAVRFKDLEPEALFLLCGLLG